MVRRFAPLGLSLAAFTTAGWGIYHFMTPSPTGDAASSQTARSAKPESPGDESGSQAAQELKRLFADSLPAKTASPISTVASPDRYAAKQQPPKQQPTTLVVAEKTQPKLPPISTSPSAPPTGLTLGDRYAAPTTLTSAAPAALPPRKSTNSASLSSEVTRGQEPSQLNPLRTSADRQDQLVTQAGTDAAAREAFAQPQASLSAEVASSKPLPPTRETQTPAARTPDDETSLALSRAKPLSSAGLASSPQSRYAGAEPSLAGQQPADQYAAAATMPREPVSATPATPPFGNEPLRNESYRKQAPRSAATANDAILSPSGATLTPGLTNSPGTGRPGESLLEGMQSPALTIQKLAPPEIQVGKNCTFAIRVQNTGGLTAQNVQIQDEVPLGTELVGTAPRATVTGSRVVWDLGTLSAGEERIVEMELVPTDEGELGSVATVTVAAQASAKAKCTRPELALRLSSKPKVLAGQQHVVGVEISNPGSGDATGVMLLESVPPGVSHEAGPSLEFEIGTLRPNETRRLDLVLTAEEAGLISNVMTVRGDANLLTQASCEFEVIAPELQLSIVGPQKRYLERPAKYLVSVDNPGSASAKNIQLVTHLPTALQFVSANNMGEYDSASHSVHWSLAELPARERGSVELVALPIESGEHTLKIETNAHQGLEDQLEKQIKVEGLAAMMFEVVDVDDPIEVGGETTYEIRVVNQGSKAAENVQVVAIMPAGLRALSAQGETRFQIDAERVVFAPLALLAPKADTTFRIQARGIRAGDQRISVQVTTDEVQRPITKEESTRVYADQ